MSKQYRIKTEAEFIEEFGGYWNKTIHGGWDDDMNYFFGMSLESDATQVIDGWTITGEMITDKPLPEESINEVSVSERPSILTEAEDIVNGVRATDYGSAKESFKRIADLTNLMLSPSERELLFHDGQICDTIAIKVLMAVKIARESNKHKRDNLVDLCGYAELLNRVEGE